MYSLFYLNFTTTLIPHQNLTIVKLRYLTLTSPFSNPR
nr:MAG TPA: hypothetical protein [Caudoviricetes sp.]